jgi:hypothetical protein
MWRLNKKYLVITIFLFVIEVLIALFVNDNFLRPYVGDVLVVILMYCFVKSFLDVPALALAGSVLLFAFAMEGLQYLKIVRLLGLENSTLMSTVLGTSFAWLDMLAYVVGIGIVLMAEQNQIRV